MLLINDQQIFFKKIIKMAAFTKNAISVMARERAKRTKIWDHNVYKSDQGVKLLLFFPIFEENHYFPIV